MTARQILLDAMPELLSGVCPVCGRRWSADPDSHCACTRPRPGDEEEIARAYLMASRRREAALAADMQQQADEEMRRVAFIRSRLEALAAEGNVVVLSQRHERGAVSGR
jgi:hypothetical protein